MVDGYIEPLRQAITALADRVTALENLSKPEDRTAATAKIAEAKAENLKKNPAQTLHASRLPITPGLPIASYNPEVQGVDPATEAAMEAEAKLHADMRAGRVPATGSQAEQIKAKRAEIAALEANMDITPAARAVQIGRLNREINALQASPPKLVVPPPPSPPKPVVPPPPPPAS
jgi:hypothetical protein